MTISAVSSNAPAAVPTDLTTERTVAVVKTTLNLQRQTANALVKLVQDAAPQEGRIDTYA